MNNHPEKAVGDCRFEGGDLMEAENVDGKYICKACGKSLRYRPSAKGYTCRNKNCDNYWDK